MSKLSFIVPGEPKGKGRPRVLRSGITYTPAGTAAYENYVRICFQDQCGAVHLEGALMADVHVYMSIPKSTSKKKRAMMLAGELRPEKKPDNDNIEKIIFDSLNKIAYHDDASIVDNRTRKWYSEDPRVEVTLEEI